MSAHTPGPLRVVNGGLSKLTIVAEDGNAVAFVPRGHPDAHANSNLFAAAPDLLKAAHRWLRLMGKAGADACGCVAEESYVCCRCEVMAAVAKAEGRS